MTVAEESRQESSDSERLRRAFDDPNGVFELLRTVRSRRVGLGYRIDSGTTEQHPVTGRTMSQAEGPNKFVSAKEPVPLSEAEEALIAWAACGPNGIAAWDISLDGGFHELVDLAGRTAPHPGNTLASDLLIINDAGAFIYNPGIERSGLVEMALDGGSSSRFDKVLDWYRSGTTQILDERPDVDWAVRAPGAPHGMLMGPYQYNLNRPGSTWFLPITDAGKLMSALINFFDSWHAYPIDEWNGGRPAGVQRWIGEGMLELPVPIAGLEQLIFQVEMYPPGAMVQNVRLAVEAMGLGAWCFCGFNPEVLFGAMPEVTRGLGFHIDPPNAKAPLSTGQLKVFGIEGVKEATYVPSPRYPTPEALVEHWYAEKYGPGAWGDEGEDNLMRRGQGGWLPERTEGIVGHPNARPAPWVREAVLAYVTYCVETFGQFPVTYNPMQAHFGVVVHHLDEDFYDQNYREGYLTSRHREHFGNWHS
jgi:hypothetical protein